MNLVSKGALTTVWFFIFVLSAASEEPLSYNDVVKLGKKGIIALAEKKIQFDNPEFNKKSFERVKVFKNGETVKVLFDMCCKYVPFNSEYLYTTEIDFGASSSGTTKVLRNPAEFKNTGPSKYLVLTDDMKKNIKFVLKALKKARGFGNFKTDDLRTSIEIYEKKDLFEVVLDVNQATGWLSIEKETGKILEKMAAEKMKESRSWDSFKEW